MNLNEDKKEDEQEKQNNIREHEEQILQKGIEILVRETAGFAFLHDEEDLYDVTDLKVKISPQSDTELIRKENRINLQ